MVPVFHFVLLPQLNQHNIIDMNRIIEIIPTLCFTSLGFYTVHRFTIPTTNTTDRENNIYLMTMDTIINKIDNIERKLK